MAQVRRVRSYFWAAGVIAPVLVATALIANAWRREYHNGLDFVPGLHPFGWMAASWSAGPYLLATILVPLIVALTARGNDRLRLAAFMSAGFCVIVAVAHIPVMELGFRTGRSRAYRYANLNRLVRGCRAIEIASLTDSPNATSAYVEQGDAFYVTLPPEILEFYW